MDRQGLTTRHSLGWSNYTDPYTWKYSLPIRVTSEGRKIKPSPDPHLHASYPARGLILDAKATQRQILAEALDKHDSLFWTCQNPKPGLWRVRRKKCVPQQDHHLEITHLVHTPATMLKHLLTIITSLSVYATGSVSDQIGLIRNPTHNAIYSPPYSPTTANDAGPLSFFSLLSFSTSL